MDPEETYWYKSYILLLNLSCNKYQNNFRLRFCLPHSSFKSLLETVSASGYFIQWNQKKILGVEKEGYPLACCC